MSKLDRNFETLELNRERFLNCPIHLETLEDPVQGPCGHVFCRKCLQTWLQKKEFCPICKKPIKQSSLYSNLSIKQIIEESSLNRNQTKTKKWIDPFRKFKELYKELKEKARNNRWDLKAIIIILCFYGYAINYNNIHKKQNYSFEEFAFFIIWTIILIITCDYLFKN